MKPSLTLRRACVGLLACCLCASFSAFGAVPEISEWQLALKCIKPTPEAACFASQNPDPNSACGNFAVGRPYAGLSPLDKGCRGCLWDQSGVITQNGQACAISTCSPHSTKNASGQCICDAPFVEEGSPGQQQCIDPAAEIKAKNNGVCDTCKGAPYPIGNPVHPGSGNKTEEQLIYRGANGFELSLFFNSFDSLPTRFKTNWRDSFDRVVRYDGLNRVAHRGDGKAIRFVPNAAVWVGAQPDIVEKLVELKDGGGSTIGWQLTSAKNDEVETYDVEGKLTSIKQRSGLVTTFDYSSGSSTGPNGAVLLNPDGSPTANPLPLGLLIRAKDYVGRVITFGYAASPLRVVKVTDPGGGIYLFAYGGTAGMLTVITFPGMATREYLYNDVNFSNALSGIKDERLNQIATFQYDSVQRVTQSERAGGNLRYQFVYGTNTTQVTSPLGAVSHYGIGTVQRVYKNSGITGDVCPECGPKSQTFDTNGNVQSRTDWKNNLANYAYDTARNLETSKTEAFGTAQQRTITTTWHSTFRLPTRIQEPGRTTDLVYDARGTLTKRTITAAPGEVREWTYTPTYSAINAGQILTLKENGPRTDVLDETTYDYYDVNDSVVNNRGLLKRVTNALGHFTEITSYNAHGQPLSITDPNNLLTELTYDARQRLLSRTVGGVGGETTTYEYWPNGLLKKVALPDSSFLSYEYDPAQRLTDVTDNLGNKIVYTLDPMGNRLQEEIKDPASVVVQKRSREYSSLNRLIKDIGGTAPKTQITQYGYDDQGNLTSIDGPLANDTKIFTVDALNRLATMADPVGAVGGTTTLIHNALDQLESVTDPRSFVTSYLYDGLGNLKQQGSPDTGKTVNTYDAAGNLLTRTDAKSQQTTYIYDALNRATKITYPGSVVHDYFYDEGTNQKGLLTRITEPAGTTTYGYNQKGRLTSEARVISGITYPTSYGYDSFGRLSQLGYPSGRVVDYVLDGGLGRVGSMTTTKGSVTTTLVSSVTYHPFGGLKTFTFANGQTYTRGYDLDGRVSSYNLGSLTQLLTYDAASRITQIQDQGGGPTRTFGYDVLDRLLNSATPSGSQTFTYDPNGNRVTHNAATYAYFASTNRLQTTGSVSYTYDANGSAITAGPHTLSYDTRGRLFQAQTLSGTAGYTVNALGQRIVKQFGGVTTVFHYDQQGRLIAESAGTGTVQREHVYLYDQPVGVLVTK
jgi:YD repeat-containing protein